MYYIFNIELHIHHADLFNTILQHFFSNMVQSNIPMPGFQCKWYSLSSLVWWPQLCLFRGGRVMEFSRCKWLLWDYIEPLGGLICATWEIKQDLWSDPQCITTRSHDLATHPFNPKYALTKFTIKVRSNHLISLVPSQRSCHASSVWSQCSAMKIMFLEKVLKDIFSKNAW